MKLDLESILDNFNYDTVASYLYPVLDVEFETSRLWHVCITCWLKTQVCVSWLCCVVVVFPTLAGRVRGHC